MFRMKLHRARQLSLLALLPLFSLWANPAEAAPGLELTQAQTPPVAVDDAALETFVTAARAIVALRRQYEPRLAAASSEAEAQALIDEARGLMAIAITDTGISVDEYLAIANAAQSDPVLRQRIETAVGAAR